MGIHVQLREHGLIPVHARLLMVHIFSVAVEEFGLSSVAVYMYIFYR